MTKKDVAIIVEDERMIALLKAYPLELLPEDQLDGFSGKADDWVLFGARSLLPEAFGRRNLAFSPSLGVSRHLNTRELLSVKAWDETHYIEAVGPVIDLLSPENLAARNPAGTAGPDPKERRFHVVLSYSTIGDGPEDALRTFFGAVLHPGSMVAQIYEEGVDGVVEIDDAELMGIAREVYPEGSSEEPSGP